MTEEQYNSYFIRYGNHIENTAEILPYLYMHRPGYLSTPEEVAAEDNRIAGEIQSLQGYIDLLQFHRQQLASRYGELATMGYSYRLELERYPTSYSGIKYYLRLYRLMEDGTKVYEINKAYQGQERREAIEAFREIKKAHPGIHAEMDIERKKWER